ncbi:MAG: alpha/beta fold hydrolase [Vicinamibacterales bacterium]
MSLAVATAVTVARLTLATGVTLEYVERGPADGVPVVFLHGVTDSWRSFEHLLPLMPASVRAIAVSLRGHGDSTRPDRGYAYGDFAADLAALLEAKGIAQAVVVGHSMGGLVAQRFALDYPARTRGLVLIGTFASLKGHAGIQAMWDEALADLTDPVAPAFAREFQESTLARPIPAGQLDTFVAESLKVPARVWQAAFRGFLDNEVAAAGRQVTVPTLVLWADKDAFVDRAARDRLAASIPGATVLDYEGHGHAMHWEDPARVAGDIARFVAGLPGDSANRGTLP